MQITPPFGFQDIVPLHKSHGVRIPDPNALPAFVQSTNAMPISYAEFAPVCHDYPIVFVSSDQGKTFAAVAVLGLANGENLFVKDGKWEENVYVPAYVRRYPFCMARVNLDNQEQQNRLICIEKAYVADDGEKLFDEKGEATARWKGIEQLLREYEADLERTREMCAILADYQLLEPFTMQATPAGGTPMNLSGMFRVQESKLEHLNAAQHKNLYKKGMVGRVYAHLLSLANFGRLLNRRAQMPKAA